MLYYENIPAIAIDTVRALYRESYIDTEVAVSARFWEALDTSLLFHDVRLVLSQLALVVSFAFAMFIVFIAIQRRALRAQAAAVDVPVAATDAQPSPAPTGQLRDRWSTVVAHLDSVRENDWKHAVIEADKLVDDALAKAGYPGATFGDRLMGIQPGTLTSLDGVWWAHRIRNRLAHEVDYFLRYTEAKQAVAYFEAALAELQLI